MLDRVCVFFVTFLELKITNMLKLSGWGQEPRRGLEQSELPWEQTFIAAGTCVSCRTINLPSFNGQRRKLIYLKSGL